MNLVVVVFQMCLEFPAQNRFIIAFPLVCGHFSNITNDFCPEEKVHIRERSLSVVNLFLVSCGDFFLIKRIRRISIYKVLSFLAREALAKRIECLLAMQ